MVILWLWNVRLKGISKLVDILRKHRVWVAAFLWAVFLVFSAAFVTNFGYLDEIHDIDEAVEGGAAAVEEGVNPYREPVVPRFKEKYDENTTWTMGTYNYLPLDLLVYSGGRYLLGNLGSPVWFVAVNLFFSGLALYLLQSLLRIRWLSYVPFAGVVMLFYSFDNASLTLLLMVLSVFAYTRLGRFPAVTGILLMSLAALTKAYAVVPLAVMVLFELQRGLTQKDWMRTGSAVVASGAAAAIAFAIIMPFGFANVMDSAVFFHTSDEARVGTSYGGTVLAEIASESDYFSYIAVAVVAIALVGSMWMPDLYDRIMLVMVAFLLVSVKSSLGTLTVAGLFLSLRLRELADRRKAGLPSKTVRSSSPSAKEDDSAGAGPR
ncbi:MAG: hypothetical protein JW880_02185 [Candidatus Thermoplasmatota archaeon]|nr:hypothetical protein [Candidatus Thermoplasmatota archaeon]